MGIIKRLAQSEVQKIAAGQVVERPAHVVKELIENALDAGSTKITIQIEAGGHALISVTDNGKGMDEEDAVICFENHATSKICSVDDLERIETFGFRGEALSSIAAVSRVTLITAHVDVVTGICVECVESRIEKIVPVSPIQGTSIQVRDLFFNIPARRKFLKKEDTEWRAIVQIVQAFALSNLEVHFELFNNGQLVHNYPAVKNLESRVVQIFEMSSPNLFMPVVLSDAEVAVSGVMSAPHISRYNKNNLFVFVNHRWVKNYQLAQAAVKAYQNMLPEGRYPVGALMLTIDAAEVDVNADPRKEEVRLAHPRRAESSITRAVQAALEKRTRSQVVTAFSAKQDEKDLPFMPLHQQSDTYCYEQRIFSPISSDIISNHNVGQRIFPSPKISAVPAVFSTSIAPISNSLPSAQEEKNQKEAVLFEPIFLGILHNTYLLVQTDDGLVLIDQHAAHERVLFELFSARFGNPETISLIFPHIISLNTNQRQLFQHVQPVLARHGIDVEYIGLDQIAVRAIPVFLKNVAIEELIYFSCAQVEHIDDLDENSLTQKINHALQAQMACKAAVKAGDQLSIEEARKLVSDLYVSNNCFNCPHGRPTTWHIAISEIEKRFKRRN